MNFCKKCGKPLNEGYEFCQSCGTKVPDKENEKKIVSRQPKITEKKFAFITNLFGGRIGRIQFLIGGLLEIILFLIIVFPAAALFLMTGTMGGYTPGIIVIVAQVICSLFISYIAVKRLHDINLSGWLAIVLLIPCIGDIAFIMLVLWRGNTGANKYGDSPPSRLSHLFKSIIGSA